MTGSRFFPLLYFLTILFTVQGSPVLLLAQQVEEIDWKYESDSSVFYADFDLIAQEARTITLRGIGQITAGNCHTG